LRSGDYIAPIGLDAVNEETKDNYFDMLFDDLESSRSNL